MLLSSLLLAAAPLLSAHIPTRFQGSWNVDRGRCGLSGPGSTAIAVTANGWRGDREGGDVVGGLPSAGGTVRFRFMQPGADEETPGVLSMRLEGDMLLMVSQLHREEPIRYRLHRCPTR